MTEYTCELSVLLEARKHAIKYFQEQMDSDEWYPHLDEYPNSNCYCGAEITAEDLTLELYNEYYFTVNTQDKNGPVKYDYIEFNFAGKCPFCDMHGLKPCCTIMVPIKWENVSPEWTEIYKKHLYECWGQYQK